MKKILYSSVITFTILAGIYSCTKDDIFLRFPLGDFNPCVVAQQYNDHPQIFSYALSHSTVAAVLTAAGITDHSRVKTIKMDSLMVTANSGSNKLDSIANVNVYYVDITTAPTDTVAICYSNIGTGQSQATMSFYGAEMKQVLNDSLNIIVEIWPASTGVGNKCVKLTNGVLKIDVKPL